MGKMDLLEPVFHPRQHDFVKGEGAWLFDRAGNRYLDLNEMCVFLGQGNRRFIDKVTEALNGITNGRSSVVRYKEQLTDYLAEHLSNEGWPKAQARAFFEKQLPELHYWKQKI